MDNGLISFASGNANPETFPAADFAATAADVMRTMAVDLTTYPGSLGHEGLRQLMARREMDREGITVDPDHVLITNGSMQAVTLAVETLCTGMDDVVVMEELSYSGSIVAFGSMGIEMVGVPVDGDGMVMEALEETLQSLERQGRRPRCIYTLATYQNPTGTVMPRSRRLEMIAIAGRYGVPIVEDNCYGDVHFDGDVPPALYALDPSPSMIYLCSLSKIFAPGVRLGYMVARPPMLEKVLSKRHDAGPNTLASAITHAYLKDCLWDHVAMANRALKVKRDTMMNALRRELGNACSVVRPPGGLFIWVRLPDDVDPARLVEAARDDGVEVVDGSDFHVRNDAGAVIRLAFGFPAVEEIDEGVRRLGVSLRKVRGESAEP